MSYLYVVIFICEFYVYVVWLTYGLIYTRSNSSMVFFTFSLTVSEHLRTELKKCRIVESSCIYELKGQLRHIRVQCKYIQTVTWVTQCLHACCCRVVVFFSSKSSSSVKKGGFYKTPVSTIDVFYRFQNSSQV